jgi:hypothetical protein
MARYFLTRLRVEGFRGINNEGEPLDLKFSQNSVNSIFAVNANGKSSLFDALCYAFHGEIPRLALLQAQENPDAYYCNRFHSGSGATIELELAPDDGTPDVYVKIERSRQGQRTVTSTTGHADPQALLTSLGEDFSLLDYRTFTRFIDDTPLQRGRAFSSLLGLSAYSDMRQSLQAASNTTALNGDLGLAVLNTQATSAQQTVQQQLTILRTSYQHVTGHPFDDVGRLDKYASDVATALGGVEMLKTLFDGKLLLDVDFNAVKDAVRQAEGGEQRKELEKTLEAITSIEALGTGDPNGAATEQEAILNLITTRDARLAATRGDLFKRLHEAADKFIAAGTWAEANQCPLCMETLDFPIAEHIRSQLGHYREVADSIKEIGDQWRSASCIQRLSRLEKLAALSVPEAERLSGTLDRDVTAGTLTSAAVTNALARLTTLETQLADKLSALRSRKDQLEKELPQSLVQLTEQVEYGRQFKGSLVAYRDKQQDEGRIRARIAIRERWRNFVTRATGVYADAEVALSTARIAAIDSEYKDMFRRIMNVADIVPELRRDAGREDLHVQLSDFHGQHALSARALLSESFRNALAISVFLAAAMRHVGAPRFVVMDDVTSSFDSGHQLALMELLRSQLQFGLNAQGLQFILLSHDGLLEKYFDRLGSDSAVAWKHHKLQGAPPMGAILSQSQDANRLKTTISTLLSAGQTTQAEPLIRQYLEFALQQIIRKVNIPVPIDFAMKDQSRMVSNCLEAIKVHTELHKSASTLVLDANQVTNLDTVHVPAIVGNWVSHYETGAGSSLSAPMLQGIVQSIDALADCFRYDDTTATPVVRKWYRSLSSR